MSVNFHIYEESIKYKSRKEGKAIATRTKAMVIKFIMQLNISF
jgi:hypothetical protein